MLTLNQLLNSSSAHQDTALSAAEIADYLPLITGWVLQDGKLRHTFEFKNYYETLAFVNAIAYVIHFEDHHPELVICYNRCTVKFDTHSVNGGSGGISINDFICAAKVDALYRHSNEEAA